MKRHPKSRFNLVKSTKLSKKEEKQRELERKEKNRLFFKEVLKKASSKDIIHSDFILNNSILPPFFKENLSFKTNKIHIIQGGNGQGKSTLLNSIGNANSMGKLDSLSNRKKICSSDKEIANLLNKNLEYSPFKMEDNDTYFPSGLQYDLSNFKSSILIFTDFSISFFKDSAGFYGDILEQVNSYSNGERRINAINNMFTTLKFILSLSEEEIENGLNLVICMDEPETGLDQIIKREFQNRIHFYLKKALKNKKLSLTFFISSHDIWTESKYLEIHNINELKKDYKKTYQKIFV